MKFRYAFLFGRPSPNKIFGISHLINVFMYVMLVSQAQYLLFQRNGLFVGMLLVRQITP